jgi:hypothetical protein
MNKSEGLQKTDAILLSGTILLSQPGWTKVRGHLSRLMMLVPVDCSGQGKNLASPPTRPRPCVSSSILRPVAPSLYKEMTKRM